MRLISTPTRKDSWKPDGLLDRIIASWLSNVPPSVEVEIRSSLTKLASIAPSGIVNRWSIFAGTGLTSKVAGAIEKYLRLSWDIDLGFHTSVLCERNPSKQEHLQAQVPCDVLVGDAAQLVGDRAPNVLSGDGQAILLPYCFLLDAGPPCTSRTPLNNSSKNNVNCVQQGKGDTGVAFHNVLRNSLHNNGDWWMHSFALLFMAPQLPVPTTFTSSPTSDPLLFL